MPNSDNQPTFTPIQWALIIGFTGLILYAIGYVLAMHNQLFSHAY